MITRIRHESSSVLCIFFFKLKTAYVRRISDWSSDVCSSDLPGAARPVEAVGLVGRQQRPCAVHRYVLFDQMFGDVAQRVPAAGRAGVGADCFLRAHAATPRAFSRSRRGCAYTTCPCSRAKPTRVSADDSASAIRSEEHTSELQSLMSNSYAVF